jgi:hypothetical protein
MEKNPRIEKEMKEMEEAYVSTWIHCLTESPQLERVVGPVEKDQLTNWLDLLPFVRWYRIEFSVPLYFVDDEFMGLFVIIGAAVIAFRWRTYLPVYISIVESLEELRDLVGLPNECVPPSMEHPCGTLAANKVASERASTTLSQPTEEEISLASQLIRGHSVVEVPGRWNRTRDAVPGTIVLP